MIVVDAGLIVAALVDDEGPGRSARSRLFGERLAAPALLDLEVGSAVRSMVLAGTLEEPRAHDALTDLRALAVDRAEHRPLLERCWELRANVTFYDAAYVALAERLDALLLTTDGRLSRAPGARCAIELLA